jgi:hypothetical protein
MKNIFLVILTTLLMIGCGGGGSGDSTPTIETVTVSGVGTTITIDRNDTYNLELSGVGVTLTIATNNTLNKINVSGVNSIIDIKQGVTVKGFDLTGSGNTVYIVKGSGISVNNTGVGNTVIEQ